MIVGKQKVINVPTWVTVIRPPPDSQRAGPRGGTGDWLVNRVGDWSQPQGRCCPRPSRVIHAAITPCRPVATRPSPTTWTLTLSSPGPKIWEEGDKEINAGTERVRIRVDGHTVAGGVGRVD